MNNQMHKMANKFSEYRAESCKPFPQTARCAPPHIGFVISHANLDRLA